MPQGRIEEYYNSSLFHSPNLHDVAAVLGKQPMPISYGGGLALVRLKRTCYYPSPSPYMLLLSFAHVPSLLLLLALILNFTSNGEVAEAEKEFTETEEGAPSQSIPLDQMVVEKRAMGRERLRLRFITREQLWIPSG